MSGSATDANVKQTTPLTQSQTKTKKAKSKQSNVNKTKLKKNSTQAKKSKKQNTIAKKTSPGQEVSQEKNQFYGRDILFEEVDPNTVKADFADEANTSVGDDQGSLIAPDLNDTQAQNNEIKAEVEALINDQINQGQIDEISRNIDVDAVQNDMAKITNNEGQQANKNQEVVKAQNENPELTRLLENNFNDYKNKQWDLVISNSTEIIKIDPSIIDAYINRSIAYTETGAIDKAISDANKAIMLNPRNPLAINNRGYAYEKSGDINNAIADYQAACNLGISISCSEVRRLRNENNTTE
jgi:tetratricopeptide (TPR) repeat protein